MFCSINTFKKSGDGSLITENKFRDQRTEQILRGFAAERLGMTTADLTYAQRKECPPRKFHGEMTQMIGVDVRARGVQGMRENKLFSGHSFPAAASQGKRLAIPVHSG